MGTLVWLGIGGGLLLTAWWSSTASAKPPALGKGPIPSPPKGCSPTPVTVPLLVWGKATEGRSLRTIAHEITGRGKGTDDDVIEIAKANPALPTKWLYDVKTALGIKRWPNPEPWGGDWENPSTADHDLVDVVFDAGSNDSDVRVPYDWYLYFTLLANGTYRPTGDGTKYAPCDPKKAGV
jgi:hypothetical protein